jgi:hypothetical protein
LTHVCTRGLYRRLSTPIEISFVCRVAFPTAGALFPVTRTTRRNTCAHVSPTPSPKSRTSRHLPIQRLRMRPTRRDPGTHARATSRDRQSDHRHDAQRRRTRPRGWRGDSMTRPRTCSAHGRCRASSTTDSSPTATPNDRTRPTRTSPATRAKASDLATAALTTRTRPSPAISALSSPAPTDYFPRLFSNSNVRARAQRESSSTTSTDLPVALAPPADVNKHGSS